LNGGGNEIAADGVSVDEPERLGEKMNRRWKTALTCAALAVAPGVSANDHSQAKIAELSDQAAELAHAQEAQGVNLAEAIWGLAELGYMEVESSARLQSYLAAHDFQIETGVADIPTAFVATYKTPGTSNQDPTIAILAEFDALPGLNQAATPRREITQENAPGHACGHHLFGAASATAAVAVRQWLEANDFSGTIKLVGTPAEEGGSGKVYLARAGVFQDVDIVLHWHPGDANSASPSSTTANKSGRFTFTGRAAHAASAPDQGRSALDGVESMNFMVNLMREHVPQTARLHYVITNGGAAPNIVPETAQVYYYVRHPEKDQVVALFDRVVKAAQAAAMGTGTEVNVEVMHGNYPVLPNQTLAEMVHGNLVALGGIQYSPVEQEFAQTLHQTLINPRRTLGSEQSVAAFKVRQSMGSTDVGDVSWLVPTVGFTTATWVPGTPAHSWQAVAAGGMSIGHKGMDLAARLLAKSAAQLMLQPDLIAKAKTELQQAQGPDFVYAALLGDREPPLDYRK
jgi:aminobenzoyl-glutamate utilization protein B